MRIVEIEPGLHLGDAEAYEGLRLWDDPRWTVIQAAKFPYHQQALGYSGRAAPKDHPEYLLAWRGNRLVMNFIDAQQGGYVPSQMFDGALFAIRNALQQQRRVLVHCKHGKSQSVALVMAYLGLCGRMDKDFDRSVELFRSRYYPYADLGVGVTGYLRSNWGRYQPAGTNGAL